MTIFELDDEIGKILDRLDDLVDQETGEITDIDEFEELKSQLDNLGESKAEKISNVACWIKQLNADAEAIKKEKANLENRQKSCLNKAENLKKYLSYALNGEKFQDARVSISYRTSSTVDFAPNFDYSNLPKEFQKITIEPRKTELKKAIDNGQTFEGVIIKENKSMQIK